MLRTIARNAYWNGLGTAGGLILGVLTSAVIARSLGVAETGSYKYVLWSVGVVVTLINFGLPHAVSRFMAEFLGREDVEAGRALLRWSVFFELGLGTLTAVGVAVAAWLLAAPTLRLPLFAGGLVIVPLAVSNVLQSAVYGAQDYRTANRANVFCSLLQLGLVTILLHYGAGVAGAVVVLLIRQLTYALFLVFHVGKLYPRWYHGGQMPSSDARRALVYLRDIGTVLLLSAIVWDSSEVFFINRYGTREQVAFYALAWEYGAKAMSIPAMLSGVLMPSVSHLYGRGNHVGVARVMQAGTRAICLVAVPLGLGGAVLAPMMVRLVLGEAFGPVGPILAVLLTFNVFAAVASVPAAVLNGTNQQFFHVKVNSFAALLNIGLALALVPHTPIVGAVAANVASQIVVSVLTIRYVSVKYQVGMPLVSLVRIIMAAIGSAVGIYLVSRSLDGWLGLGLALACGMFVYLLLLCGLRVLSQEDVAALRQIGDRFPSWLSVPYLQAVTWLARSL